MALYNIVYLLLSFLGITISPETPITYNSRCSLTVINGRVACQDVGRGGIACNVLCDGTFQGPYRCSQGQGWDKKLPHCASDLKDLSGVAACRDNEVYSECQGHCDRSCYNKDKPSSCTSNVCVGACVCTDGFVRGPDGKCAPENTCTTPEKTSAETTGCNNEECMRRCSVLLSHGRCKPAECKCLFIAPEKTSAEGTGCNTEECMRRCSVLRFHGRCTDVKCQCLFFAPEKTSTEATACDLRACVSHCLVPRLPGKCEDGKCKCHHCGPEQPSASSE